MARVERRPENRTSPRPDVSPALAESRSQVHTGPLRSSANEIPSITHFPPRISRATDSRMSSLSFTFPPLFQPNTSSTSLAESTAEGRPIPLDNSIAAERTTALRELNRSQPSPRHRYTKSTGPSSTATRTTTGTYSQPVIVRTYSGPPPASAGRPISRRVPLSTVSVTTNASSWRPSRNGMVLSMARQKGKSKSQSQDDVKLPPLEAFSFKSIMADIQQDIGADLDRIAEICARSRYSLSNQYEVHVAPHGSGAGFMTSPMGSSSRQQVSAGPTLQAISSDDEHSVTRHRKRRSGARRRSAAYGTLETIMSSSRSSEEDKSKKKSAQELADDVRGRVTRKTNVEKRSSNSNSGEDHLSTGQKAKTKAVRRKSTSFATAVIDSTRSNNGQGEYVSPRSSGTALVGEPAVPQASGSHLEIRTSQKGTATEASTREPPAEPSHPVVSQSMAAAAITRPEEPRNQSGLLSGLSNWIPWRGTAITEVAHSEAKANKSKSYAEGSLRKLMQTTEATQSDQKGKGIQNGH